MAVAELEQAYQLDKDEAKFALLRGLLSQAETREKEGNEEGVLAACKRILDISPHEREAVALQRASWTRRGDAALAKNDLEGALNAYQIVGDHEKVAEVEILRERQALATLQSQAQSHIKAKRWTEAAASCEELIALAPDQDSRRVWEKKLKRCQEEVQLAFFFAQGVRAMQNTQWVKAQLAFLEVVNRRIEYQKDGRSATELLDQARERQTSQIKAIPVTTPKQNSTLKNNIIVIAITAFFSVIVSMYLFAVYGDGSDGIAQQEATPSATNTLITEVSPTETPEPLSLAAEAERVMDQDAELAILLGVEAVRQAGSNGPVTAEAMTALHNVVTNSALRVTLLHNDWVRDATWSGDNSLILTASDDKTAKMWDAASGDLLLTLSGHTSWVYHAAWSGDESRILTASDDKTAKVWDAASGDLLFTLSGDSLAVNHADWSGDDSRIVTASDDKTAKVWDTTNGDLLFTLTGHRSEVTHAVFSHDDRRILTASKDKTAKVWDGESGQELFTLAGHTSDVIHAVFSHDDRRILTASWDDTAKVWDGESGQELFTLTGHTRLINHGAFSHDDRRILTTSLDKTAKVWDAESGQEQFTLTGHTWQVNHGAFSHDDRRILTTSLDKTAKVWDATSGELLFPLSGHTSDIMHGAWSGDDSRIVTASADGMARVHFVGTDDREALMEFACQRISRHMTPEEWQRYVGDIAYRPTCPNLPSP